MIFYFTGTGNSLYVAKKIQKAEGGKLVDMAQSLKDKKFNYNIKKGEKMGIIFPVYFQGLPTIVSEFITQLKLEIKETPFIYTAITCYKQIGNADKYLANLLKEKNLLLESSYSVKMPENYIMLLNTTKKENINEFLDIAENQIENLIESIKNNKKGYLANHGPGSIFSFLSYSLYGVLRRTKKFYVIESCTSCGQCEKICPSEVIKIKDGKPKWTEKKCSHCTACINRCPFKAIEYGNSTKKRERYLNPYVKISNSEIIYKKRDYSKS